MMVQQPTKPIEDYEEAEQAEQALVKDLPKKKDNHGRY